MRRREFIGIVGGVAAWPRAARAQQPEGMRRIGIFMPGNAEDAEGKGWIAVFQNGLRELGWIEGHNVRFEYRWGAGNADRIRNYAVELVALAPDVVFADASVTVAALLQATRTLPIVFANVADPVGAGYVDSLARPGGNASGFLLFEFGVAGKWLDLLKQIAPALTRVAVIRDPTISAGIGQWTVIQAMAPSTGVDLSLVNIHNATQVERHNCLRALRQWRTYCNRYSFSYRTS
jgi:putative tryptophan/tyrosine transport system substrate-binding protein